MADRETVQFKTKSGKNSVELVTYFTRREQRQIKNALFGDKDMQIDGKSDVKMSINMATTDASEDIAITLGVLSLNNDKENVLERFLELPSDEAEEIKGALDKATGTADSEKKDDGQDSTKA